VAHPWPHREGTEPTCQVVNGSAGLFTFGRRASNAGSEEYAWLAEESLDAWETDSGSAACAWFWQPAYASLICTSTRDDKNG